MSNTTKWEALREERRALIERIRALPFEVAWLEVRAALEASPSPYADEYVLTVYEGPTRSFLLPLPFELLQDFIQRRGTQAADWLFRHAGDSHPLVAAYSLHALSELEDSRLAEAVTRVAERLEHIESINECFAWDGTLAEYGRKLHDDLLESK